MHRHLPCFMQMLFALSLDVESEKCGLKLCLFRRKMLFLHKISCVLSNIQNLNIMQTVKMSFSSCEATGSGDVRITLASKLDLSNPLALLQNGGTCKAAFTIRNIVPNNATPEEVNEIVAEIAQAFANLTFDVKRAIFSISLLSNGKGNAVMIPRADGTQTMFTSLVFNSVNEEDTEETMLDSARVSFINAVNKGRYVLTTTHEKYTATTTGDIKLI